MLFVDRSVKQKDTQFDSQKGFTDRIKLKLNLLCEF